MKSVLPRFGLIALFLTGLHAESLAAPADASPAFTATPSGLKYAVTTHGTGPLATAGQVVLVHYTGTLPDGTVFDSSRTANKPFAFTLGRKQVIKGWDEAFALLHVGDQATLLIPPDLAYGDKQRGPIPPNSTLRFEVELVELKGQALSDLLQDTIDTAGLEAARARFAEAKAAKFAGLHVSESQLNGLGYRYLGKADKLAEARAVLQWNVELFPESANVYDSLGEADVKAGDRAAALAHYAKSLELDPKNKNAAKFLDELKATPDQPGALIQMQARMQLNDAMDAAFETAESRGYDVPALKAKLMAFLDKYPDDPGAAGPVGNFFYYAESAGLEQAKAEWAALASHPNAKVREMAAQKMALAELIKSPLAIKFTAADGREVDLARLRGKVVLVDFWATWCGPCVEEIPNVVAAYEQYHAQGFEIVGISFDQAPDAARPARRQKTAEQVLAFTREHKMPWPQFYDGSYWENPFGKQYGVRGIPAMFLLDRDGMVVSTNARGKKLEEEVKRLLKL
ncbi:MAG TPA: FKBP-type peptidyl-prolyl cis-trans isomerase [Lacunisphaera sp.]|nr:FKBP-type peptidyl-prolyl cis-trans isomerase [Lacunisphaera sp.]